MTDGLPPLWRERLESLSAYEAPSQASELPILHAHLICKVAGTTAHVLSRVGPCGLDYSGRSNRIAHHLLLDDSECSVAGPAWLLQRPDLFRKSWDGEPQIFPFGPNVPSGDEAARECTAWQQMSGDAGWAGQLVQSFREQPLLPSYIIYAPGTDVLPLIREAIALLPPQERWQVTFSTYFGHLPSDASCAWRCVLAGSAAARGAGRPGVLAIDLTSDLPRAPDSEFTEAARRGQMIAAVQAPMPVREMRSAAALVSAGDGRALGPASVAVLDEGGYGLEPVGRVRVARQRARSVVGDDIESDEGAVAVPRSRVARILGWTGWLCAAALALSLGFIALQNGRANDSPAANAPGAGEADASIERQSQASTESEAAKEASTSDGTNDQVVTDAATPAVEEEIAELRTKVAELEAAREQDVAEINRLRAALADAKEELEDAVVAGVDHSPSPQSPPRFSLEEITAPTGTLVGSISVRDGRALFPAIAGHSLAARVIDATRGRTTLRAVVNENTLELKLEAPREGALGGTDSTSIANIRPDAAHPDSLALEPEDDLPDSLPDSSLIVVAGDQWLAIHTRSIAAVRELIARPQSRDSSTLVFELPEDNLPESLNLLPPWEYKGESWHLLLDDHQVVLKWNRSERRINVDLLPSSAFPSRLRLEELIKRLASESNRLEKDDEGAARRIDGIASDLRGLLANAPIQHAVAAANELTQVIIFDEFGRPWKRLQLRFEAWTPPADEEPKADPRMRPGIGVDVKRSTQ